MLFFTVNPMMSTSSKLNPSVYSHPMMAQDPVLAGGVGGAKGGPSFKSELPLHRYLRNPSLLFCFVILFFFIVDLIITHS